MGKYVSEGKNIQLVNACEIYFKDMMTAWRKKEK